MSTLGRNGITNKFQQDIPTNSNEEVSAEDVRGVFTDVKDSYFNLTDDDIGNILIDNTDPAQGYLKSFIDKVRFSLFPLFFVTVEVSRVNGSIANLNSSNSNNPSVTVSQSNSNNVANVITVSYTDFYGATAPRASRRTTEDPLPNATYTESDGSFQVNANLIGQSELNGNYSATFIFRDNLNIYLADL